MNSKKKPGSSIEDIFKAAKQKRRVEKAKAKLRALEKEKEEEREKDYRAKIREERK